MPALTPSARCLVSGRDLGWLLLMWGIIAFSWCLANGKFALARWGLPTSYADPTYADFLGTCGYLHSVPGVAALPLASKFAPNLAAPEGLDWSAVLLPDQLLIGLFSFLTASFGLFAGFNVGLLLGHLAAATTCYLVARKWIQADEPCSLIAALTFGLAPYLFAQSPHHINCQYVWHLPLFPVVWTWAASETGLPWRSRRFWLAAAIAAITGLQNPYYTFVFCQLTLLGAACIAWRQTSWNALLPACAITAVAAVAFFVGNLDTFIHRLTASPDGAPLVAQREYRWMDIYGFKLIDLFIPSFTHHSETLARFGIAHRQSSVLNDEEGCAYLGLLGVGCLLFLVSRSARALLDGKLAAVPIQGWWVLWIVLFFNTGGMNSMIAAFTGFTLFRTATRYSIVVLVIVLLYAAQRLSAWRREASSRYPADLLRIGSLTAAIAASLVVLWDQVPRSPTAEKTLIIERLVGSDRAFVGALEAALTDEAMVFQLPVMDGTPLPGVASSDHYRPTLYGTKLRWSHGALPGSKTLQWQQSVQQLLIEGAAVDQQAQQVRFNVANVRQAIDEMRRRGFSAIYVNRNGFPDQGKGLFDVILELGYEKPPIYSGAGDLACILLGGPPTAAK